MTFKRTEKTKFMPNAICFPGGGLDKSDESIEWNDFLQKSKVPLSELELPSNVRRPFIFNNQNSNLISRQISLRINAIRETFEEMGIVLCKKPHDPSTSPLGSFLQTKSLDIPAIQKQIHNHEKTLLSFCKDLKVVPDITNIHDWSCWLTPTMLRPKRFETAFFLVALNSIPPVYPEAIEVKEFSWKTPDELLSEYKKKEIWLPPPQFVELKRMNSINSFDRVVEIAKSRNRQNMELLMPLQFKVKDGNLHVLPGDDLYHSSPNYYESGHDINEYENFTFEEMKNKSKNFCRSEQRDLYDVKLYCNVEPSDGHFFQYK